jgi:hypothetical protein
MATFNLFGFQITTPGKAKAAEGENVEQSVKSFVVPQSEDGAITLQTGAHYGTYVDMEGVARNEIELITRYRSMAMHPECETAVDDIVNEAIVQDESGRSLEINMDNLKQPDALKKKIEAEFDAVLKLLNFQNIGSDLFRRWYVDGRIFYHVLIDETKPKAGIKELRYVDPRRIRKIREIQKTKDPRTGIELIKTMQEYYLYNERGIVGAHSNLGARISIDSIINVNSGLMDEKRVMVLSYLHKAIKPLNCLRMVEDAVVIYRMSRAPERRVFYIDVGNLPKQKAEQYLKDIMTNYRNKLVYDSQTGEIKDDRKHLSMLEDFWLPRREGARGTEIETLPSGQNLGELEDVKYFERKLYKALHVPISRLESTTGFNLGRSNEISRDELKFAKFIQRIRNRFAVLFDDAIGTQLALKGICTKEEWREFREDVYYDFRQDNNYEEIKESELLASRLAMLQQVDPFIGRMFSGAWVQKNILRFTEQEIEEMMKEIEEEKATLDPRLPPNPLAVPGQDPNAPPNDQQQPDPNVPPPANPNAQDHGDVPPTPPFDAGANKLKVEDTTKHINSVAILKNVILESSKRNTK